MHIHELNPVRTAITLVIFAAVIVFGLLTVVDPRLKYTQNPEQTLEMLAWEEGAIYPFDLVEIFDGTNDTSILIDLRNAFEFGRGSIPGAENISSVELLSNKNIDRLEQLKKDGFSVIVFADNQLDANGPWMVLRQLGFDNVNILYGGYNYYNEWKDNLGDSYGDDAYFLGTADFDYAEVAASTTFTDESESDSKSAVTFKRKKKTAVAEGGC